MFKRASLKTPVVLQMEAVECGAASLCIILGYYGHYVSLDKMREVLQVSRDGTSVENLIQGAEKFGLNAHVKLKTFDALQKEANFPCIVLWNNCHFLVVEKINNKECFINDPACGRMRISKKEFKENYSHLIISFEITENFVIKKENQSEKKYLYQLLKYYKKSVCFTIFTAFFMSILTLLGPLFSRIFIDNYLIDRVNHWILPMIIIMLVIAFGQFALTAVTQLVLRRMNYHLLVNTNYSYVSKLFRLPIGFFNQRNLGDLTNRVTSNATLAAFVSNEIYTAILSVIQLLMYGVVLLIINKFIFIVTMLFLLVDYIYFKNNENRTFEKNLGLQMAYGKLSGQVETSIHAISTIKATGQENVLFRQWSVGLNKYLRQIRDYEIQFLKLNSFTNILSQAKPVVILGFGGFLIHSSDLTIGGLVAFSFIANYLFSAGNALFSSAVSWQQTKATIKRTLDVIDEVEDSRYQGINIIDKNLIKGDILFEKVCFGYNKNLSQIISNLSLKINAGEHVVLVGPSGSGKTTFIKLLQGFYPLWSGRIFLDNFDLREINNDSMSEIFSVVDQNIFLLEGTLKENLELGCNDIDENEVIDLMSYFGMSSLLSQHRKGLDFKIMEGGKNVSGGQAQLIEIIRALINKPKVLILDEGTSALDSITIEKVMLYLKKQSITTIMVTHQVHLIKRADKVVLMRNGEIIDQGKHQILLNQNAYYKSLIEKV